MASAVVGTTVIDPTVADAAFHPGYVIFRYFPPTPAKDLSLINFTTDDIEEEYLFTDASTIQPGQPIVVRIDFDWRLEDRGPNEGHSRDYSGTVSLNGNVVFTFSDIDEPVGGSRFLPIIPCFASTLSGDYRIEVSGIHEDSSFANFIQKGLGFRQDLSDFEVQPEQEITINNDFGWDYGANPNNLILPSWEVEIINPQNQVVKTVTGAGRHISAKWTPEGLTEPIRLVPSSRFFQSGDVPIYAYRLKAKELQSNLVFEELN